MPSTDFDAAAFTTVDWNEHARRLRPRTRTLGLIAALAGVAVLFAYDYVVSPPELFAFLDWDVTRADWLLLLSLVFLGRYVAVPLATNRTQTLRFLRRLRSQPIGVVALAVLAVAIILGVLGPGPFFDTSYPRLKYRLQPPVFTSIYVADVSYYNCVGDLVNGYCRGTWRYPLGTTRYGENVLELLFYGLRIALQISVPTVLLMGVVGTTVGALAGYFGGWVDDVLMRYVDLQQTVPAIIIYILFSTFFFGELKNVSDGGLFAFVLVFGLLDWGGIARAVRTDALSQRSAGYVRAAKASGASDLQILRRRIVPNARRTIVTSLTRRIPLIILAQVVLAYLNLNRIDSHSFGRVLRMGLTQDVFPWYQKWWMTTFPVLVLVVLVVAFNVFGDSVRDIIDARQEVE